MTDCPNGLMRDLLPEHALGLLPAAEAARVAQHLAECATCRADLVLLKQVRAAQSLGVPRMDVAAIASALPSAPATSRPAQRIASHRWFGGHAWQYAAAAGLVLVVGGGIVWRAMPTGEEARLADSSRVVVAPVESAGVREPLPADDGISFGGGLSDLSVDDLQALLGQMDSVRTLPSSDPESVTPVIAMNEGGKTL